MQRPSPSAPRRVVRWGIGDFIWVWFAVIVATSLIVLAIVQVVDPPPAEIGITRFDRAVDAGRVRSVTFNDTTNVAEVVITSGSTQHTYRVELPDARLHDGHLPDTTRRELEHQGATVSVVEGSDPGELVLGLAVQAAVAIGLIWLVSRFKGRGSLAKDFGLVGRPVREWFATAPWALAGAGVLLVTAALLRPLQLIYGENAEQSVVSSAERSHGLEIVLTVLAVAVLAPIVEELLYRGLLLRSLLRRLEPGAAVLVSALVFAFVHPLGDPTIGSLIATPPILVLGLVSAAAATATGDLRRSVWLHFGFNATTVLFLYLS